LPFSSTVPSAALETVSVSLLEDCVIVAVTLTGET